MGTRVARRQVLREAAGIGSGLVLAGVLAACAQQVSATAGAATAQSPSKAPLKLTVWGGTAITGLQAQATLWNQQHPTMPVTAAPQPGGVTGSTELQKFLTAEAAGTAADVVYIDRFQLASLAFRGALSPIDHYVDVDKYDLKRFYPEILKEAYGVDKKLYGLPNSTDDRIMFWNKDAFTSAGLDPNKGPVTYADLQQYAVHLTKSTNGKLTQLGWNYNLPGVGVLYQFGWEYGGHFLADNGRKSTMNSPEVVDGVQAILDIVDAMGGAQKIAAFTASFQTKTNDPFIAGQQVMVYGFELGTIAQYKPHMNFGYAMFPVPKAGQKPMTFSGGFAWTTPAKSKHPDASWQLMRALISKESIVAGQEAQQTFNAKAGQGYSVQWSGQPALDKILIAKFKTGIPAVDTAEQYALKAMQYTRVRPISPAAQEAWDQLTQAWQQIFYHKESVQQALTAANQAIQNVLDQAYTNHR
ncbi:MAG: extracellular solute-binding protein [Chloroflexi bacterium]|nr:extracellular solute-binding protein [Chloroflexota bacterium]